MNLTKAKSSSKVLTEKTVADLNLLQKLKPRQINIEKERLYEENLELKLKNNSLKEEILKLKTKVHQIEKELNKKDENDEKNAYSVKPANLVTKFKTKIKDLKSKVQEKSEEIEKLQKNIKSSKIYEQEKEISVYIDECSRLKRLLEETLSPNETLQKLLSENHSDLNSVIDSFNKENKDLQKNLNYYKQESEKYKQKLFELEKKKKQMIKPDVQALKKEITKLKDLNESLSKSLYEASNKERGFRDEILKLKKIIKDSQNRTQTLETNLKEASGIITQLNSSKEKQERRTESQTQETLPFSQVEPMPLMIKTLRLALTRANLPLETFLETLDKSKSGKVTYDDFSQALQKLGTYLTTSHFNSIPSACCKSDYTVDLLILNKLVKDSQKILLIDSKEQTPVINTFDFESPVHTNTAKTSSLQAQPVEPSPKTKPINIAIFPPVDSTKELNSDSCKHSKRTKSKKFEVFISDDDSKSKGKRSSKTSERRKPSKRKSKDSEDKSSISLASQEPVFTPELQQMFSHIRMKMQLNRLPKQKLLITLFGAIDKDKSLTRSELLNFLQKSPFSFAASPELDHLLNFLLIPGATIKSIGEKLLLSLPDWEIFSADDEELFDYQLGLIISKNKQIFKDKCKLSDSEHKGSIQISEFEKILQELGMSVPEKLWSYMKLLFYSNEFQLDMVPYRYFIKAYGNPIDDRQDFSNVSENADSQIVNMYLSAITTAMQTSGMTLGEVFGCDDDGLICVEQFKDGLKTLGFEEIDEAQVMVFMEAMRFQGSFELCLHVEEMNEILQSFALGRISHASESGLEGHSGNSEVGEDKNYGIIKLVKSDSQNESPFSF